MNGYIPIAVFTLPSEMLVLKSLFDTENIKYLVKDELTVQVHNFLSNAVGGITIEVEESKFDEALFLIKNNGFENHLLVSSNSNESEIDEKNKDFIRKLKWAVITVSIISVIVILGIIILTLSSK
jgi:hypothetical protein